MSPEWMFAIGAIVTAIAGFTTSLFTARHNRRLVAAQQDAQAAQQEAALLGVQNELIVNLRDERNRMDTKITEMRKEHRADLDAVKAQFSAQVADALAGESLARQYVAALLPLVPPPPPAAPPGWRP